MQTSATDKSVGRSTSYRRQASSFSRTEKPLAQSGLSAQELNQSKTSTRIALGAVAAGAIACGIAFKDGAKQALNRIGNVGELISSLFAIPATLFIPLTTALGEYEGYKAKDPTEQSSNKLVEIVYPILSIAFAPMTAFGPLKKATQSTGHMITTLINMPHILFTLFSYTGGRAATLWKSINLASSKLSDGERFKFENERKLFRQLGDIGSDNAAVTPQGHQFMTGILNIVDFFKGDFTSIKNRFSEAPVTSFLCTFISSVCWIPTYIGKSFDTIIRTLESVESLKNAISEDSPIYKSAMKAKDWWHTNSASGSFLGNILKGGREFGKIVQAVASPLGMINVVWPAFDHFRHGFKNVEAGDTDSTIRFFDRVLNIGAFAGHCYFTILYGLFVRLPQTITTTTFYVCNAINRARGVLDKPNDPKYLDPRKYRDIIFNPNKGWAKSIYDFARSLIEKKTGKKFLYDDIYKVIARQECFTPLREALYKQIFESEITYEDTDKSTNQLVTRIKEKDQIVPSKLWGEILKDNRNTMISQARERLKKYLKEASLFNENQINDFFNRYHVYDRINAELEAIIDGEIKACETTTDESVNPQLQSKIFKKPKIKSNSFQEMILHPIKYWDDIKEVFKFRTFFAQFVVSPLNVLDFVNIVEMGDKNLPYHLSDWLVKESSIRIGDYGAGNIGEMMPVYLHAVQSCGKGMSHIYKAGRAVALHMAG